MERTTRNQRAVRRGLAGRVLAALVALVTTLSVALICTAPAQAAPGDDTPKAAAGANTPSALSGPVTGTLQDGTGSVQGTVNVIKFAHRNGELVAIAKFTGTVTDAAGKVTAGSKRIAMPLATEPVAGADKQSGAANPLSPKTERQLAPNADVAAAALSCQILDLVLGPLDLDLLGLQVHLDTVHLNITAEGGPGNLLGNLLCAVAGLLDGSTGLRGILNGIVTLLNQLLAVLG